MILPALGPGPQLPGKQRTFVLYREQLWEWDSLTVGQSQTAPGPAAAEERASHSLTFGEEHGAPLQAVWTPRSGNPLPI